MTETHLVHQILSYIRCLGIFAWRQNTSGIYMARTGRYRPSQVRGLPDILGVIPRRAFTPPHAREGVLLGVEVKTRTGRLALHQVQMLAALARHGAITCVARSWEDVREVLRQRGVLVREHDGTQT